MVTVENIFKRQPLNIQEVLDMYLYGLSLVAESGYKSEALAAVRGMSDTALYLKADIIDSDNTIGEICIILSGKHFVIFEEYSNSGCSKITQNVYLHDDISDNMYTGVNNSRRYPVIDTASLEEELTSIGR